MNLNDLNAILEKCGLIDLDEGQDNFLIGIKEYVVKLEDIKDAYPDWYDDIVKYGGYFPDSIYPILYFYKDVHKNNIELATVFAYNDPSYFITEEMINNIKIFKTKEDWDPLRWHQREPWYAVPFDESILIEYDKKFKDAVRKSNRYKI